MRFRKHPMVGNTYQFFVGGEWLDLCYCMTCKKFHGVSEHQSISEVDEKIRCCKRPDNWRVDDYGVILKFINEHGGLTK